MSTKSTPKSCSCAQCRGSRGKKPVQHLMKLDERAFRHKQNRATKNGSEDVFAASCGPRYG